MENDTNSYFGDPLLDSLLELSSQLNKREAVLLVNPNKQEALSLAYDFLNAMVHSVISDSPVDVQYHYSTRSAAVTAVVPFLYLSVPSLFAAAIIDAANVQIQPASDGKIRISLYFSDYFREVG